MRQDFAQFRLNEAVRPSLSPVTRLRGMRGLGDVAAPRFFDINGNTITTIACGQPYMFEVPGYTAIWLQLVKDGKLTFDAPYEVPMPPYTSNCELDPGSYEAIVLDPSTKQEIGRTTLKVTGGSLFGGLSNTTLAIGAVGILFLLSRRKRA